VLKFIRRNAEATWVKLMFVAIVVVFIFWGMGGMVGGEKAQVVARVNRDVIEPAEFNRAYNNLLRMYQDVYKDSFKPEMAKMLDVKGKAVDQLIRMTLLRQEAERLGLTVGESELRDSITTLPAFQEDGRFDRDQYLRVLRANNLTPGDFEDAQREQLLVDKLQDLILAGVHVSEAEVRDAYRFDNEKVDLRCIKVDGAAFLSQVKPTDEEVQAYFTQHQEAFREPDRVRVEYILYPVERYADKVDVSDADVQQYYDNHRSEYTQPEQVHARHILFKVAPDASPEAKAKVRQKAEEVLAKVKAGEDFAALARQYSEDASAAQGGDLGQFGRGKMVKPFEDAAFALAPGETSGLVESPFGLHIIKVEAKEDERQQTLDEVRSQIVAAVKQEKAHALAQATADADRAKAVAGATLASVAEASGLTVSTPSPVAKNEVLPGMDRNPNIANALFAADVGEVGPIVDTPKGLFLFRVTEKLSSHLPALAEVHDRVEDAVRKERAEEMAKAKAQAVLAELQNADIDTVASRNNLKVEETGPFGRQGTYVPKVGNAPDLKKAAFQLTAEKPVAPAVYLVSGSSVVAVLKERIPADEAKFEADKANLMRRAEEQAKGQAMEEFVNYLKARASIEVGAEYLASIPDTGHPLDGSPRRRR
jgi:peptidyl-prolyl cis-trans isomerase D